MARVLLEVIAQTAEDCREAEGGGADRIEFCSTIELGGLTPSIGAVQGARNSTRLPLMVMVRPRPGGFDYSRSEFEAMLVDISRFADLGVEGIVFGILNRDRAIDLERCHKIVEATKPLETVFHRAFDVVKDPFDTLERLVELGVTRILTSGQHRTAFEGAHQIRALLDQANGRIQILPGSGLRCSNLQEFLSKTGCNQVHLSAFELQNDLSMLAGTVKFNMESVSESEVRSVNSGRVAEVKEILAERTTLDR